MSLSYFLPLYTHFIAQCNYLPLQPELHVSLHFFVLVGEYLCAAISQKADRKEDTMLFTGM